MVEPRNGDGKRALRSIRRLLGCLVVVPIVAIAFGSQWTLEAPLEFDVDEEPADLPARVRESVSGLMNADLVLERPVRVFSIELRDDASRGFRLLAVDDEKEETLAWTAFENPDASPDTIRRSPWLRLPTPARSLRLVSRKRDPDAPLPAVRILAPTLFWPHWTLAPALFALWLCLFAAGRRSAAGSSTRHALAAWERFDPWIAAVLVYLVLFRWTSPGWFGAAAFVAITAGILVVRRFPAVIAVAAVTAALAAALIPRALAAIVVAQVSEEFDLTVDHRPKPNDRNINSDGLRFDREADAVDEADFVVLFLGDSFTFGSQLRDHATYPMAFQRILNLRECGTKVLSVNFGWPSASPLLGLRLLRRIGYSYKPDLVLYNVDMTDFHDDLRYERALRSAGGFEVDTRRIVQQLLDRAAPWLRGDLATDAGLRRIRRPARPLDVGGGERIPSDRFFVTSTPLDESRQWIEAGVMKNLEAIRDFSVETLDVPMVAVVFPRAYQYSTRESPRNWERNEYDPNGPYVREPFRYFAERRGELPYPVVDMLPAFETSSSFPLFLGDDPHWNRAGARLAATSLISALNELDLIPCDEPRTRPTAPAAPQ